MYITRRRFDPLEYGRLGSFNTASTRDGSRTSCNYTVLRRLGNAPSRENKWVIWAISHSAPSAHCEFTKWCLENFAGTKREREKRKIDPDNMFFTYTLRYDDQHILVCSLPQIEQRLFGTLATLWDWLAVPKNPMGIPLILKICMPRPYFSEGSWKKLDATRNVRTARLSFVKPHSYCIFT